MLWLDILVLFPLLVRIGYELRHRHSDVVVLSTLTTDQPPVLVELKCTRMLSLFIGGRKIYLASTSSRMRASDRFSCTQSVWISVRLIIVARILSSIF